MSVQAEKRQDRKTRGAAPLLASTAISVTGDGVFMAAAPLFAVTLTRSPVAISAVTAAFYAPWLLFGLSAGALVDRWPRRRVMVIADLVRALLLTGLAAAALTHVITLPLVVTVVVCIGIGQCFFDSASQASIPAIVGRDKEVLARVNGKFWSLDTLGRGILGPPIGSSTFTLRQSVPFVIDAASFLASSVLVRALPDIPSNDKPQESLWASTRSGLRYLAQTRELLIIAASGSAYNFAFNVSMAVFILYAQETLGVPKAAYGLLMTTGAVGGVLAGFRGRSIASKLSYRKAISLTRLTQAVVWAGIAAIPNVWSTGAFLLLLGASSTISSVVAGSAQQALTPHELLGRTVSAYRVFAVGGAGLGAIVGGVVADFYGLTAAFILSTAVCTLVALLTWPYGRFKREAPDLAPDNGSPPDAATESQLVP